MSAKTFTQLRAEQGIRALHKPYDEPVEVWHEDDEPCSDRADRADRGCPGHAVTMQTCQECGHTYDDDTVAYRPWPCPTVALLDDATDTRARPAVRRFRKAHPMTRRIAALVTAIVLTFGTGLAVGAHADTHTQLGDLALYEDVQYGHPHYPGIRYVTYHLDSPGFGDGTWRPDQPITRGQMATLLERQARELGR